MYIYLKFLICIHGNQKHKPMQYIRKLINSINILALCLVEGIAKTEAISRVKIGSGKGIYKRKNSPKHPTLESLYYRVGLLFQSHRVAHGEEQIGLVS